MPSMFFRPGLARPQRVKAGPSAPRTQEILIPGEDWKLVGEGFKSTRGPACNARSRSALGCSAKAGSSDPTVIRITVGP